MIPRKLTPHFIDSRGLPGKFPTHRHEPKFWESLGRAIATFGVSGRSLGKAIFSFTATRPYEEAEIEQAYLEWLPKTARRRISVDKPTLVFPGGCRTR